MQPRSEGDHGSGFGLIVLGLALALVGAGSVMLLVLALSHLYVAHYATALGEMAGCALAGGVFLKSYGPYLDRLERRAPQDSPPGGPEADTAGERSAAEPAPTSVVVAVATAAYGLLIILAGLCWTEGTATLWNAVAGTGLIACAAVVWWLGRGSQ
jgi:hypothetical protein